MKTVYHIARILLGLQFGVLGLNGFFYFIPPPPYIPPAALAFATALHVPHYDYFTFGVQVICGLLLLLNRFVPFALIVLAAVLSNILAFHITMWPQSLFPLPIIATILWFLVAWPIRSTFAPLFVQKVEVV